MERLDGDAVRAWAHASAGLLDDARARLDALNVFPVADSDTGTNVLLTVAQGAQEADAVAPGAGTREVAQAFALGALVGARGNSGVIVSQLLHGFAGALGEGDVDARGLAAALDAGQHAARAAVSRPVEGTILTAARRAAQGAARAADAGEDLGATVAAALREARDSVHRSTGELPALRSAGVVDAGAAALALLLEALAVVVSGSAPVDEDGSAGTGRTGAPGAAPPPDAAEHDALHTASGAADGEFEVMFLVGSDGTEDLAPVLRERMQAIGESVVVVGGQGVWQVHVHTDHPDRAVRDGAVGAQHQVTVRHLVIHGHGHDGPPDAASDGHADHATPRRPHDLGLVAGTRSPALVADLARAGAVVQVLTDEAPTPGAVLRAVVDAGAADVLVLPGDDRSHDAALAARDLVPPAGLPRARLHVLDARTDVQVVAGLAAAVAARPAIEAGDSDGVARALADVGEVVGRVRHTEVTSDDADEVLAAVDGLLAGGGEVLTVLAGEDVPPAVLDAVVAHVARAHPAVEVVVLPSGRATATVALGAE